MLGQKLFAIMPFVKARWTATTFWLGETTQKLEEVIRNRGGGEVGVGVIAVMKDESECGKNEEGKEVAAQTTRQDGAGTKWGQRPWSFF